MKLPGPKKKIVFCPRCNSPALLGTAFCDACGARIGSPPACTLCGTLLVPDSRFCPSCGTMVGSSNDNLPDEEGKARESAGLIKNRTSLRKKPKITLAEEPEKAPDPLMMIPEPDIPESFNEPDIPVKKSLLTKKNAEPTSRVTIPPQGRYWFFPREFNRKSNAITACVLILIAGAALVFLGILSIPHVAFSPAVTTGPADSATETLVPTDTVTMALPATATASVPVTTTEVFSLAPGPTQVPPSNFQINLQAERDPRTRIVSVQYMGGKGQMGVRDILVRLTRSDRQILTDIFKPVQVGSGVELQGTEKVDRVEVIVRYYTGDEYTVIDKIFEYKIRSG